MMQRRTMLGWFEWLDQPGREYTESEFMCLMLFHIRQHIGTTNGRMLAAMNALDASRDELRELAAAARRNGDGQADA